MKCPLFKQSFHGHDPPKDPRTSSRSFRNWKRWLRWNNRSLDIWCWVFIVWETLWSRQRWRNSRYHHLNHWLSWGGYWKLGPTACRATCTPGRCLRIGSTSRTRHSLFLFLIKVRIPIPNRLSQLTFTLQVLRVIRCRTWDVPLWTRSSHAVQWTH